IAPLRCGLVDFEVDQGFGLVDWQRTLVADGAHRTPLLPAFRVGFGGYLLSAQGVGKEGAMGMLDGKTAIVTGGARGIGLAIAKRFIAEGARVVIADIEEATGKTAVAALGSAARFVRTDVGAAGDARNVVAEACGVSGDLDILVNNAGIIHTADFLDIAEADFDRVLRVNLKGMFLVGQV